MADNQENLTDETSDEMSISYRMLNLPNDNCEDEEENNEGIVEYLDIDLETASVRDTEEYCSQVSRATPTQLRLQPSVLKKNSTILSKRTNNPKPKSTLAKSTKNQRSSASTISSLENNVHSTKRTMKRKATSFLESDSVHAVVDEINTKLAASATVMNNDADDNKYTEKFTVLDSPLEFEVRDDKKRTDLDSVDLFFQSMALTVMTLPAAVQAKIKMDICKVIATAEMQYSAFDTSQEFDRH